MKVLADTHSLDPEIRQRFIAKGRSLRRVRSPHVVTVHDIGENEHQQPYLVLEYADRGTPADRVATLRAQSWQPNPADIIGPDSVSVGDEVDFEARVSGVASWVWTLPDGTNVVDASQVSITARSPGPAEVLVRARTSDGDDLEAVHQITVTE